MVKRLVKIVDVEKRYMTVAELTKYLGFGTRNTQQEWRDSGQLPYHQMGRVILYDKADVDAFIARHKVQPIINKSYNYGQQAQ